MSTNRIQPNTLFHRQVNGYTLYHHVVTCTCDKIIFISGQLARNKDGEIVGPKDMRAQIRQVGENIRTALRAAGADLSSLVKTTTYVTDIDEFFKHVDVRHEYFGPAMPTSTTIEVRRLSHPDLVVEVEAVAVI